MSETLLLIVAFGALPLIILFAASGCVGDDPKPVNPNDYVPSTGNKPDPGAPPTPPPDPGEKHSRYVQSILGDPKLLLYVRLDEKQGDTVARGLLYGSQDYNGDYKYTAGIHLGQKGALTSLADTDNTAAEFSGTVGYVEFPYLEVLNPSELSIEFWMRPEGTSATPQCVLGSYELDAGDVKTGFLFEYDPSPTPKLKVRFGGINFIAADIGPGTSGEGWRHVVLTYRVSTPSSTKLYVNALSATPAAELPNLAYKVLAKPQPLRIGAGEVAAGVMGAFFEGRLDEVAIYTGELPAATIRDHYLAGINTGP